MKKFISVIMCIAIILSTAVGCTEEDIPTGPAEINILLEGGGSYPKQVLGELLHSFYPDDEITLTFTEIPEEGAEREAALTRIRAEIMAGEGPDIFYLPTHSNMNADSLFVDVNEAMYNGIFLPLDDYIAKSDFIHPESYIDVVYNAGRTVEGQMVIPTLFYLPMRVLYREKMANPDIEINSFDDILNSEDDYLIANANYLATGYFDCYFPKIADYEAQDLVITEAEIAAAFDEFSKLNDRSTGIDNYMDYIIGGTVQPEDETVIKRLYQEPDEYLPIYLNNSEGGLTAKISAFAAVSRNCENPDAAFKVFEMMMSYPVVGDSKFRHSFSRVGTNIGMSTGKNDYGEQDSISSEFVDSFFAKVTSAEFRTELSPEIVQAKINLYEYKDDSGEIDCNKAARALCVKLQMMLAE